MTATPKTGRGALLTLPIFVVPIAFIAALPWLKAAGVAAVLITAGAAGLFVTSYSNYLSFCARRGQDEVQKASTGFAAQWGVAAGQAAFVLLLALPPFLDLATTFVRRVLRDPHAPEQVVILSMTLGFCTLVLLQSVGSIVIRALWWRSKR